MTLAGLSRVKPHRNPQNSRNHLAIDRLVFRQRVGSARPSPNDGSGVSSQPRIGSSSGRNLGKWRCLSTPAPAPGNKRSCRIASDQKPEFVARADPPRSWRSGCSPACCPASAGWYEAIALAPAGTPSSGVPTSTTERGPVDQGCSVNGLKTLTPGRRKSASLPVATVRLCRRAMAAM